MSAAGPVSRSELAIQLGWHWPMATCLLTCRADRNRFNYSANMDRAATKSLAIGRIIDSVFVADVAEFRPYAAIVAKAGKFLSSLRPSFTRMLIRKGSGFLIKTEIGTHCRFPASGFGFNRH